MKNRNRNMTVRRLEMDALTLELAETTKETLRERAGFFVGLPTIVRRAVRHYAEFIAAMQSDTERIVENRKLQAAKEGR